MTDQFNSLKTVIFWASSAGGGGPFSGSLPFSGDALRWPMPETPTLTTLPDPEPTPIEPTPSPQADPPPQADPSPIPEVQRALQLPPTSQLLLGTNKRKSEESRHPNVGRNQCPKIGASVSAGKKVEVPFWVNGRRWN